MWTLVIWDAIALIITPCTVMQMLALKQTTGHHLDQSSLNQVTDVYMNVNSLWSKVAMRRHRAGSTLVQILAYCLTASNHYPHQCWLTMSEVQWQSPRQPRITQILSKTLIQISLSQYATHMILPSFTMDSYLFSTKPSRDPFANMH